ncbi:serine hydrolase domain-containing protein [Shewanella sp. OMA3-2]|uniref:serine hydrolase domain-containing protein n=1 Tax=Shewanella sp. OMA3-2 TaxID=2908650 RepID=UPI001F3228E5|nr:serine hydrolase domain-containing protein [Shewanella sp. OMA3-2]UJF21618.1 beta-lactamase family protein [Shewanella sp. OMA3-2]
MIISLKLLIPLTYFTTIIYTLLWFSFAFGSLQANAFELTATDIQSIIDKDSRAFSGVIMISDNSKNYVNYQAGETIKSDSVFLIGSISKTVTATLVLQAVDQQKLTLTDNISDHLTIKTQYPVTIAQLLNHTSGILPPKSPSLIADSQFAPTSQFSYSNYGYALLGQILTQVYQQPYSTLVNQFATQNKLDIQANIGSIAAMYTQQPRLAQGYMEQQNQRTLLVDLTIDNDFLAFGGMQASTAGINQFLNGLHQGHYLSASSYQAMTNASTTRHHRWGEVGYGFGLQISQQGGVIEYSHSGYIPGYISLMLYYPQPQLTVVILENTSWDLDNIDRVFGLQDKIRQTITEQLMAHE